MTDKERKRFISAITALIDTEKLNIVQPVLYFNEANKEVLMVADLNQLLESEAVNYVYRDTSVDEMMIVTIDEETVLCIPDQITYADFRLFIDENFNQE